MQPKLIVAFERLTESGFQTKVGGILAALDGNPHFAGTWPSQIPSLEQLRDRYAQYEQALIASLTRDMVKIAQRNQLRQQLSAELKQIVGHLETVAQGSLAVLKSTGFDLRRRPVRPGADSRLPAPDGVRAQSMHGMFRLRADRLPGASAYEIQLSTATPAPISDDDWRHALTTTSVQRIFVRDLPPGYHWARLRGINSNGGGEWSVEVRVLVE